MFVSEIVFRPKIRVFGGFALASPPQWVSTHQVGSLPAPQNKKAEADVPKLGGLISYGIKFLQSSPEDSLNLKTIQVLLWISHWTAPLLKPEPRAGFPPDLCISNLVFDAESRGPTSCSCLRSSSGPKIDFLVVLPWPAHLRGCQHTKLGPFLLPKMKKPKQMFLNQGV